MAKEFERNRAVPATDGDGFATDNTCDTCGEPLLFAMQDRHHKFSIGLLDVLKCLKVAEDEGYVPPLPDNWWLQIDSNYRQSFCRMFKDET